MSAIDLSTLPFPAIVETIDYEDILAQRKAAFVALYPAGQQNEVAQTLELDSEPISILLQENAYREIVWRQRVNDAVRAVMLAYATGSDLDQAAARVNVTRLVVTPEDDTATPPTPAVMETDTALRLRVQMAYEGMSVAGPRNAYIEHALSADGRVLDVNPISPDPAYVTVPILSTEGDGTASQDLLDIVTAALNDEDVRPLTDRVTVQSAAIVNYQIEATIYLDPTPESEPILQAAQANADAFAAQRKIGKDVNRSAIFAALHVLGVTKVELTQPAADIVIGDLEAAYCTGITLINGGVSE